MQYAIQNISTSLDEVLTRYFGINSLRPLQAPAIDAVLNKRDSLVVLPTGGGKSLCYQAPAIMLGGTTVVISPLISLMKDQVDGLRASGVNAIQLDSTQSTSDRNSAIKELFAGNINLLFVSPERLSQAEFRSCLQDINVQTFAVDEAHCISHWGHDFRPEYRQLSLLKEEFPNASLHAYTATATEKVRLDIAEQLNLDNPEILVGNFDRANLLYRTTARRDLLKQVLEVIERHPNEGGIVYCIKRSEVDTLTERLKKHGINAKSYHAGMDKKARSSTQEAFVEEKCDVIVATVAFGMGIDRSNVRYVIHASMPQSVEHYQQETGRAGRDGLEAECVLLHSGQDFITWKYLLESSSGDPEYSDSFEHSLSLLEDMDKFCRTAECRHKMLVNYFGQSYDSNDCGACDMCLGETTILEDSSVIAMKILSCIARVKGNFGIKYICSVLRGEKSEMISRYKHDELSTYALMKEYSEHDLRDWTYQLIRQGLLDQDMVTNYSGQKFPVLKLNELSREVLTQKRGVRLLQPVQRKRGEKTRTAPKGKASMQDVDQNLFEEFRKLRRELASERKVPPYVIFSDKTLLEFASRKPKSLSEMRQIHGVGDVKLKDFGPMFLEILTNNH